MLNVEQSVVLMSVIELSSDIPRKGSYLCRKYYYNAANKHVSLFFSIWIGNNVFRNIWLIAVILFKIGVIIVKCQSVIIAKIGISWSDFLVTQGTKINCKLAIV
jgi:hypothetical protein